MKIADINGYKVHIPTSGGKAGKGHQKTSSIQLREGGRIVKQFRFVMDDAASRHKAIAAAKEYVRNSGKPVSLAELVR